MFETIGRPESLTLHILGRRPNCLVIDLVKLFYHLISTNVSKRFHKHFKVFFKDIKWVLRDIVYCKGAFWFLLCIHYYNNSSLSACLIITASLHRSALIANFL